MFNCYCDVFELTSHFRVQVNQRNVPGIDDAYLAMDTEEGVEVVWNEVMISERKNFQQLEVRLGKTSMKDVIMPLLCQEARFRP